MMLNIIDGTYNIPFYIKMEGGVLGGASEGDNGDPLWPYNAWLGDVPANKCNFQGFPERLYCMVTLKPEMPGTEQFFMLEMENCKTPLFTQAVVLPDIQQAEGGHEQPPVGCHASLGPRECKTLGGEYRKINDTQYLCFCPP